MISRVFHRLLVLLLRLLAAWLLVAVVVELAMIGPRGRGEAVGGQTLGMVRDVFTGGMPGELGIAAGHGRTALTWLEGLEASTAASLRVTGLALVAALAFGPVLGVAAGRFRRHPWFEAGLSPLFAAGWVPGFWLACLAVWWQVHHRGVPGYADAEPASGGPTEIEPLWRAALVAVPVALVAIGWQIRFLSGILKRAARAPHVRAAYARGLGGGGLFYRHVFRNSLDRLVRSVDRSLPAMLGVQVVVEWAFRYPGLGRLVVECARAGQFAGLLAGAAVIASVLVFSRWTGESLADSYRPRTPA